MPYFIITETTTNTVEAQKITIDDRTLNRMITSRGLFPPFRMNEVTIRTTNKAAKTDISLCFTNGTLLPISGVPRCLHTDTPDHLYSSGRPGLKPASSIRWASRSGSQRQRRFDWKPPNIPIPQRNRARARNLSWSSRYHATSHADTLFVDHVRAAETGCGPRIASDRSHTGTPSNPRDTRAASHRNSNDKAQVLDGRRGLGRHRAPKLWKYLHEPDVRRCTSSA
jgi:hypothetical protein